MFLFSSSDQIKLLLDKQERLYERQSDLKLLLEECKAHGGSDATISVSNEDWSGQFEWDGRAEDIRFNIFGISAYRANQREVRVRSDDTLLVHVGVMIAIKL